MLPILIINNYQQIWMLVFVVIFDSKLKSKMNIICLKQSKFQADQQIKMKSVISKCVVLNDLRSIKGEKY